MILDPGKLETFGTASFYFCGIFLSLSLVAAILLQAAHEGCRYFFNKYAMMTWLRTRRRYRLSLDDILEEMPAVGSGLFWLPYWQLTGQIGAIIGSHLNINSESPLIFVFANVDDRSDISREIVSRIRDESLETSTRREISSRAQAGINSLHTHMRNYWNTFDYYGALATIVLLGALFTTLEETRGQRFLLYSVCFFSWFATPILRRMIERLVPFR